LNIGKKPAPAPSSFRVRSPSIGSTLIVSAPRSASTIPHVGPITMCVNSTTRRPASGWGGASRAASVMRAASGHGRSGAHRRRFRASSRHHSGFARAPRRRGPSASSRRQLALRRRRVPADGTTRPTPISAGRRPTRRRSFRARQDDRVAVAAVAETDCTDDDRLRCTHGCQFRQSRACCQRWRALAGRVVGPTEEAVVWPRFPGSVSDLNAGGVTSSPPPNGVECEIRYSSAGTCGNLNMRMARTTRTHLRNAELPARRRHSFATVFAEPDPIDSRRVRRSGRSLNHWR
jgi:hypothetical protein